MLLKKLIEKLKHLNRQRNLKTKILKKKLYFVYINAIKTKTICSPSKYKKITLLMTDLGLGDVIVTSFLIKSLKDAGFSVNVIVEKRISYLFDEFIDVDSTILFENMKSLKKQLKNNKIDLLIDLMDINDLTEKRIILIHKLKPLHTIGFNQKANLYDTSITYKEYNSHFTNRMIKVLDLLNIKYNNIQYHFNMPASAYTEANDFIAKHNIDDKKIIVFNPFGSFEQKSFSYQQIEDITKFLSKYKNTLTIIVGEKDKLLPINDVYDNVIVGNLSSFFTSLALIELCDLLISVDTSVVHAANAFNKKLIGIYTNMQIGGFDSNIVWSPNYKNAKQVFTKEFKRTSIGDEISKMKLDELFKEIEFSMSKHPREF